MGLSRLSHAINACRAACHSLPNDFQRERIFTGLSAFLSLMTLCAVKKSQSYLEVMRQMKSIFETSSGQKNPPSASAFSQARGKLPSSTCCGVWLAVLAAIRPMFARDAERRVFGLRPVAFDGTWAITPHDVSTKTRWPQPKYGKDCPATIRMAGHRQLDWPVFPAAQTAKKNSCRPFFPSGEKGLQELSSEARSGAGQVGV